MAGGAPAQPAASSAGGLLAELSGLSGAQPNGHGGGAAGNAADMFGGLSFTGQTFDLLQDLHERVYRPILLPYYPAACVLLKLWVPFLCYQRLQGHVSHLKN